jgi:hypothetical protein
MKPAPPGQTASQSMSALTKRELAIMADLADLRVATAKDLVLMHFSARSLTYGRSLLSRLTDEEYVFQFVPPHTTRGNPERAYVLGSRGSQALADIAGIPVFWYYHPYRLKGLSFSYLRHALLVTRIVAAMTYFVRTHSDYSLRERRLFYELARMQRPPTGDDKEKPTSLSVIADAWLHVERSDGQRTPLWIEADCGTEMRKKFQEYLKARLAFLQNNYEQVFGTPAVCMCFITTGHTEDYKDERRRALQAWTQEALAECGLEDWASNFRFAAVGYNELFTQPFCDGAIWYFPDSQTPIPLFTVHPTKPQEEKDHGHNDIPNVGQGNDREP